ncbi:MAG: hypothetical protein RLZZ111_41 [Planctomycetota bacterium]|jgi:hypothetical protein
MHLPRSTSRPLHDHDDDWLLEAIAASMVSVDPRSASGAPVLVADLKPHLTRHFPDTADFVAALLRLERSDRLTLIRRDPAFPAAGADEMRCVHDGLVEFIGVALR